MHYINMTQHSWRNNPPSLYIYIYISLTKLCKGLQCEEINPTFFSTVTNNVAHKTVYINIHVVRTFPSFSLHDRPPFKTASLVTESHCPLLQTARINVWPTAVQRHTKLYSSKDELEKAAMYIHLADWTLSVALAAIETK